MKFLKRLNQRGKVQVVASAPVVASAQSALAASAAVPDSGFNFVKNSQGASAAIAELSQCLDAALDQIELDGDLSDQLKLELGRLDKAASLYANSTLSEEFARSPWTCSSEDAGLIFLAWKCAAATHGEGVVETIDGITVNVLKLTKPSLGGSVKAALVALAEQSTTPQSENQHLPVLVVAIRGSKSTVDFMVNANGKSEDARSLFNVNDLLPPAKSQRSVRAHAGFLNCAIALVKYIDTLIVNSKAGHILFTGHSAGGAVASLLFLKYLAEARGKASVQKFSCITFGAPPVMQPNLNEILQSSGPNALNLGVTIALVNEYDLVSRVDQSYVRSLVDLYRSIFQLAPVLDDEPAESKTISSSAESATDSEASLPRRGKTWNLPEPAFWPLGEIILLRVEAVEVIAENGVAEPAVTMKRILKAFKVEPEEFAKLVFCRIPVHRRNEYEKRVKMILDGHLK